MMDLSFLLTSSGVDDSKKSKVIDSNVAMQQNHDLVIGPVNASTHTDSDNTLTPLPQPDLIAASLPRTTRDHLALIKLLNDQRQVAFDAYDAEKGRYAWRYLRATDDDQLKSAETSKRQLTLEAKKLRSELKSISMLRWWHFFSKKRRVARMAVIRYQLVEMKAEYQFQCGIANAERRTDVMNEYDPESENVFKAADERWKQAVETYNAFKKRGSVPLPETDEEEAARRLAKHHVNGASFTNGFSFDFESSGNSKDSGTGTYGGEIERPKVRSNSPAP